MALLLQIVFFNGSYGHCSGHGEEDTLHTTIVTLSTLIRFPRQLVKPASIYAAASFLFCGLYNEI